MKELFAMCLGAVLVAALTGCRSVTPQRVAAFEEASTNELSAASGPAPGEWHTIKVTPRLSGISTWDKFNPVWWYGNADDPDPPAWYRPGEKRRVSKWRMRNPFHNFTFYVIGIADKPHLRSGHYPRRVANPEGGWNVAVAKYRFVRLPFVAYTRGRFDFYLGWRERGNFGARIHFGEKRPQRVKREAEERRKREAARQPSPAGEP